MKLFSKLSLAIVAMLLCAPVQADEYINRIKPSTGATGYFANGIDGAGNVTYEQPSVGSLGSLGTGVATALGQPLNSAGGLLAYSYVNSDVLSAIVNPPNAAGGLLTYSYLGSGVGAALTHAPNTTGGFATYPVSVTGSVSATTVSISTTLSMTTAPTWASYTTQYLPAVLNTGNLPIVSMFGGFTSGGYTSGGQATSFVGAIDTPSTDTALLQPGNVSGNVNIGVEGVARSASTTKGSVGVLAAGMPNVSGAKSWGLNAIVTNWNSLSGTTAGYDLFTSIGAEIDVYINNTGSGTPHGEAIGLQFSAQMASIPSGGAYGIIINPANTAATLGWTCALCITDGPNVSAINIGVTGLGNNLASQQIQFNSRNSSGTLKQATLNADVNARLQTNVGFQIIPTTDFLQLYAYGGATTNVALFESDNGAIPVSVSCRTKNITSVSLNMCAGLSSIVFNDNASYPVGNWAIYMENRHFTGAGPSVVSEVDITEFGTSSQGDPYAYAYYGSSGSYWTVGLYVQSGGSCGILGYICYDPVTGTSHLSALPASAAIAIGNNGSTFRTGLQFNYNAIYGNDGMTDNQIGYAITMPRGDVIAWGYCTNTTSYPANCAANTYGAYIGSSVNTAAGGQKLLFSNLGTLIVNTNNAIMLDVAMSNTYTEGLVIQPGTSGTNTVALYPTGATDVNLSVGGVGTGSLVITGKVVAGSLPTGTPSASICIDSSNNIIRKTSSGACI